MSYLVEVLGRNHIDYMITGSIVSNMQGEPRSTHGIDVVVVLGAGSVQTLLDAFPSPRYYLSEGSIKEAIRLGSMFNVIDVEEGDKVDFWILTDDPFDKSRFERRYAEKIFGMNVQVSRAEDTILAKLRWAKRSGGSEKQLTDALRVYEVQFDPLEIPYLERWVDELHVSDLWKEPKTRADHV